MGKSQRYQAAVDGHRLAGNHWSNLRRFPAYSVRSRNTDFDAARKTLGDGLAVGFSGLPAFCGNMRFRPRKGTFSVYAL